MVKNHTYDSDGNKSAFSVNVGNDTKLSLQYSYDGESKLTAVTDENGNNVAGCDYDGGENLKKIMYLLFYYLLLFFLITVCCVYESVQKKSENIIDTHIEEADELNERLKTYNDFLEGKISSEDKEDKEFYYLTDYCNWVDSWETKDGILYTMFDMTGDGMPELHVITDISYTIHTIENNQLVEWYQGDRYNELLNNGMILQKAASESGGESYIVLDSGGVKVSSIWFGKKGNDYRFSTGGETITLSKNQWEKLKDPFWKLVQIRFLGKK
jgi:hypothetical protein